MKYLISFCFSGLLLYSAMGLSAPSDVKISDLALVNEESAPPPGVQPGEAPPAYWRIRWGRYYGRYYGHGYGRYYYYGRHYYYGRYYYGAPGSQPGHEGSPESLPSPQVPDRQ